MKIGFWKLLEKVVFIALSMFLSVVWNLNAV
jgi:hypothetical protein